MNEGEPSATRKRSGCVCTFYSYKGGVGRSMALANVAALLAKWGQRVLVVDWDLEAPGIEKYFEKWIRVPDQVHGVVDLIESFAKGAEKNLNWRSMLIAANLGDRGSVDILSAGKAVLRCDGKHDPYTDRLRSIDWENLFERRLGNYLEDLRTEWKDSYDFVLLDSRTGITDIGGICTILMPDALISLFTTNQQSLDGVVDVMHSARKGHSKLPVDRRRLMMVPVPSRDESGSEFELSEEWRGIFAGALTDFFGNWVPEKEDPTLVLDFLKIPYFAYWSHFSRPPDFSCEASPGTCRIVWVKKPKETR